MQFDFDLKSLLPDELCLVSKDAVCEGLMVEEINDSTSLIDYQNKNWSHKSPDVSHAKTSVWHAKQTQLCRLIDEMGRLSALAQKLKTPITMSDKVIKSGQRVYLLRGGNDDGKDIMIGMIKVAYKDLYIAEGKQKEARKTVLCLLDFYVVESLQKQGYGFKMFSEMLKIENYDVRYMAYDVPSDKLISFLKKHFGLKTPIMQSNNFVVFQEFFCDNKDTTNHEPVYRHETIMNPVYGSLRRRNLEDQKRKMELWTSTVAGCLNWNNSTGEDIDAYGSDQSATPDEITEGDEFTPEHKMIALK